MGNTYIFSDTHHGPDKIIKYLKNKSDDGKKKLDVRSTGDFLTYRANDSAPKELTHPYDAFYDKGDKKGMAKHEASWGKQVVKNSEIAARKWREARDYVDGGSIHAIMGNADYGVSEKAKRHGGKGFGELYGGGNTPITSETELKVDKKDSTSFVYVPHDPQLLSKYQGKDYQTIKKAMESNPAYTRIISDIEKNKSSNIVVMMHESPAPENWYSGDKAKQRLPDALRAHYDTLLEKISKQYAGKGKKITVFHGHLHQKAKKYSYSSNTANIPGVNVQLLNIDDVVNYDTVSGKYKVEKAPNVTSFSGAENRNERKPEAKVAGMYPKNDGKYRKGKGDDNYKMAA